MSRITLAAPCFRRYDLLQKLFESAERGSRKPDQYFVVDNGCRLAGLRASGEIRLPENTVVACTGRPNGVAGAWNIAFRENPDWVIMSNDDVELHEGTVAALEEAANTSDAEFLFPSFSPGAMFCVFLAKRAMLERVGPFDERFYPAYFEDNDYHRRMRLAGVKEMLVDGASYGHFGSATLKSLSALEMEQHHKDFEKNRRFYIDKWGGPPGHEDQTIPQR